MDVLGNLELEKPAVFVVCANDEDFVDRCVDGKAVIDGEVLGAVASKLLRFS